MTFIFIIVLFLSLVDGFAVRRGSVCLLRATVELVDGKKPQTLLFIIECGIFAMTVSALGVLISASSISLSPSYMISHSLVVGAILYGLGIALNGTCMIGTLNRLLSGNINYFATLLGVFCGYAIFILFFYSLKPSALESISSKNYLITYLSLIVFIVGFSLLLWRFRGFLRYHRVGSFSLWRDFLQIAQTRNFITTASIGLSSGLLLLLIGGDWSYTRWMTLWQFFSSVSDVSSSGQSEAISLSNIALGGFIAGIILAVILSNTFSFVRFNFNFFARYFSGGILLGLGIGLIPGGNDTLIFYSLPSLSFHALAAIIIIMLSSGFFVIIGRYFSRLLP